MRELVRPKLAKYAFECIISVENARLIADLVDVFRGRTDSFIRVETPISKHPNFKFYTDNVLIAEEARRRI